MIEVINSRSVASMIDTAPRPIDYAETGEGPTIVLVPGSCSTGVAWRPVMTAWQGGFRCVTTSLLGYGRTAERRTQLDADMAHEAEILEAVIRRAGSPVHLVGHSFGGLVSLAVARRRVVPLLSLTILEAPACEILRHMGEQEHYRAFRNMTDAYFAAFRGGKQEAIAAMIDFYGGAGTFASWPQRVRDYAVATTPVNLLDWVSAYGFPLTRGMLASIKVPTLVLWGRESHPAVRRANELLGRFISKAAVGSIAGAKHFMISTHPEAVAGMVAQHVASAEEMSRMPVSVQR
jgi:pimeloyl-ACP methyl ester carboxylesterase